MTSLNPPTQTNRDLIERQLRNARKDAAARFAYWSLCLSLPDAEPLPHTMCVSEVERAKDDWLRAAAALQSMYAGLGEELQGHDLGSSGD